MITHHALGASRLRLKWREALAARLNGRAHAGRCRCANRPVSKLKKHLGGGICARLLGGGAGRLARGGGGLKPSNVG